MGIAPAQPILRAASSRPLFFLPHHHLPESRARTLKLKISISRHHRWSSMRNRQAARLPGVYWDDVPSAPQLPLEFALPFSHSRTRSILAKSEEQNGLAWPAVIGPILITERLNEISSIPSLGYWQALS
jgi:hypothetical protein